MADTYIVEPDVGFINDVAKLGGGDLKKCFQCATCSVTCELSAEDNAFPRKEMLYAQWGLKDKLLADPNVFLCYQCNDCSARCPRDAKPGEVMAAIRSAIYLRNSVPSFMGKALANPQAMLGLFLLPALILFGLMWVQHSGGDGFGANLSHLFGEDHVIYHHFLAHGLLEMLFLGGNILIFLLAAVGFVRFYKSLQSQHSGPVKMEFFPAVIATIKEIIAHKRFATCVENRPRKIAHLGVLFGFFGCAATAGLAVIYMLVWMARNQGLTFDGLTMTNPIKWLGIVSGLAMIIGSVMMITRKAKDPDTVGATGFPDQMFLYMIMLVPATGMLCWLLRLANIVVLAYPIYFVHLVMVFFLLWYMPYSKFAHMIYRGLALVWANQIDQIAPKKQL